MEIPDTASIGRPRSAHPAHLVPVPVLALTLAFLLGPTGKAGAAIDPRTRVSLPNVAPRADGRWVVDVSDYRVTAKAAEVAPVVEFDPSLGDGPAFAPTGEEAGRFRLFPVDDAETPGRLLAVWMPTTRPSTTNLYFFVGAAGSADLTPLGVSEFLTDAEIDPDTLLVRTMIRAAVAPEKLSADALEAAANSSTWPAPFRGRTFLWSALPHLASRLIRAAAEDRFDVRAQTLYFPSFPLRRIFRDTEGAVTVELPSAELDRLARELQVAWPNLSDDERLLFLNTFQQVDGATGQRVGALLADQLERILGDPARSDRFGEFFEPVWRHLQHLTVDSDLRETLVRQLLRGLAELPPGRIGAPIDAVAQLLTRSIDETRIGLPPARLRDPWQAALDRTLGDPLLSIFAAGPLFVELHEHLSAAQLGILTGQFRSFVRDWDPSQNMFFVAFALPFILGPLDSEDLAGLSDRIDRIDFSKETLFSLSILRDRITRPMLERLPASGGDRFLDGLAAALLARFDERAPNDAYQGSFEPLVQWLVQMIKAGPDFARDRERLLPLLLRYHPIQPGESDEDFRRRLDRIERLWRDDRLFVIDLRGGFAEYPDHLAVLSDYARNHRDWVDLVVFSRDEGGGEAKPGAVQFSVQRYNTPYALAYSLLHEGGHSLQLRDQTTHPLVLEIPVRWYRESSSLARLHTFVSDYGRLNAWEFWAEHTRFFHDDTRAWLDRALELFAEGDTALLHVFLYVWDLPGPVDAPAGTRPLFRLAESGNGILEREFTPADWQRGNRLDGVFEFRHRDRTYTAVYRDHVIQELRDGDRVVAARPVTPKVVPSAPLPDGQVDRPLTIDHAVAPSGSTPRPVRFLLLSGPEGASIDPTTGVLSWTPPRTRIGTNLVLVGLADADTAAIADVAAYALVVDAAGAPIRLVLEERYELAEDRWLVIPDFFVAPGLAADRLVFSLLGGGDAIAGVSVDPVRADLTLQPSESGRTGNYTLTLEATYLDDPAIKATRSFVVQFVERNQAPEFIATNRFALPWAQTLRITDLAVDRDLPANRLTYRLEGETLGASLDPSTGTFEWTPAIHLAAGDYPFQVAVTDDGEPPATARFSIMVELGAKPEVRVLASRVGEGVLRLSFPGLGTVARPFSLERSTDLIVWTPERDGLTAGESIDLPIVSDPTAPGAFYRILFR